MSTVVISGDTSGSITLQAPAVSGTTTLTLPTTTATLATLTTPSFATTIGVGGATASASGSGISFPATQSASSDANTLDDYEEGTWTPSLTADSGTATYGGDRVGRYTKIGRFVYINCTMTVVAKNTLVGNIRISGLPFTAADSNSNGLLRYDWGTTISGYIMTIPQVPAGGTAYDIQLFNNLGFVGVVQDSQCGATINIYAFTACYSI